MTTVVGTHTVLNLNNTNILGPRPYRFIREREDFACHIYIHMLHDEREVSHKKQHE